jgi:hypothetical protein
MKTLNNLLIIVLCFMIVGFFANFAQNDYGMQIVTIGCLSVSALLFAKVYLTINLNLNLKIFFLIAFVCATTVFASSGFYATTFNTAFDNPNFLILYLIAFFIFLTILIVIIPLLILIINRKLINKIIIKEYFEFLFLGMFCFGIYMKNSSKLGASIVLVLGGLIIFPLMINAIKILINSIRGKTFAQSSSILTYIFLSLTFVAFIFKTQHWPWANTIVYLSSLSFGLLFFLVTLFHFVFNVKLISWWQTQTFTFQLILVCLSITTFYMNLRKENMMPDIYSNKMPKAYEELKSKANGITTEGDLYGSKSKIYLTQYENFLIEEWQNN